MPAGPGRAGRITRYEPVDLGVERADLGRGLRLQGMGQLRLLGDPPRHEEAPPAQRSLSMIRDLSSRALTGGRISQP